MSVDEALLMPKVRFLPADVEIEVREGTSVLDAALDNNIRIDHNCGGNCACSTCHVIVEDGFDALNGMTEDEMDMLDEVETLSETSRLACQCKVRSDLIVRIPEKISPFDDDTN
ncbi:MAG TPA: 2Fe-2S iron-sulfur cluster-binding protein [Candidatus Deferrimicrobium sp.]|nr:2Fe-2S iron-sulfur cluster-binding protein [Candidatus Deferrimicrobium sp.]